MEHFGLNNLIALSLSPFWDTNRNSRGWRGGGWGCPDLHAIGGGIFSDRAAPICSTPVKNLWLKRAKFFKLRFHGCLGFKCFCEIAFSSPKCENLLSGVDSLSCLQLTPFQPRSNHWFPSPLRTPECSLSGFSRRQGCCLLAKTFSL